MPDQSTYYVATGYVEPGYFITEPAPPELIKKEQLTVYRFVDAAAILKQTNAQIVYKAEDAEVAFRPLNRTTAYVSVTEV